MRHDRSGFRMMKMRTIGAGILACCLAAAPMGVSASDPLAVLEQRLAAAELDLRDAFNATRRARTDMREARKALAEARLIEAEPDPHAGHGEGAMTEPEPGENVGVVDAIPSGLVFGEGEIITGGAIPKTAAPDTVGAFRTFCQTSHFARVDPIVFPGNPAAGHLHRYMGNRLTDENSTYESLRTSGENSCFGGRSYRTAIWAPVLFDQAGRIVDPDFTGLYYKRYPKSSPNCTKLGEACANLPAGLEIIYGSNYAMGDRQDRNVRFDCNDRNKSATIAEAARDCRPGEKLRAMIVAPNCWDGERIASPDHQSHLAYATRDRNSGQLRCPSSHPLVIPTVTYFEVTTLIEGDRPAEWEYSSDRMAGQVGGTTFHSDYFEAIDPEVRERMHSQCMDKLLNCGDGSLGDGTKLARPEGYNTKPKPRLTIEQALAFGRQ
jgi:hypothetical protein